MSSAVLLAVGSVVAVAVSDERLGTVAGMHGVIAAIVSTEGSEDTYEVDVFGGVEEAMAVSKILSEYSAEGADAQDAVRGELRKGQPPLVQLGGLSAAELGAVFKEVVSGEVESGVEVQAVHGAAPGADAADARVDVGAAAADEGVPRAPRVKATPRLAALQARVKSVEEWDMLFVNMLARAARPSELFYLAAQPPSGPASHVIERWLRAGGVTARRIRRSGGEGVASAEELVRVLKEQMGEWPLPGSAAAEDGAPAPAEGVVPAQGPRPSAPSAVPVVPATVTPTPPCERARPLGADLEAGVHADAMARAMVVAMGLVSETAAGLLQRAASLAVEASSPAPGGAQPPARRSKAERQERKRRKLAAAELCAAASGGLSAATPA